MGTTGTGMETPGAGRNTRTGIGTCQSCLAPFPRIHFQLCVPCLRCPQEGLAMPGSWSGMGGDGGGRGQADSRTERFKRVERLARRIEAIYVN